ncbi:hypothetical protein LJC51_10825 [Lachnospiraceae bacterium OttesenSCG-928-J05]|nr:hypothetical protein [Lachnospiraceae bacterium OttesenSCG-928-J05]
MISLHKNFKEIAPHILYPDFYSGADSSGDENRIELVLEDASVLNQTAEEVMEEAKAEAAAILEEARRAGYEEGLAKGYEEGKARAEQEGIEQIRAMNGELEKSVRDCIKDLENIKEKYVEQHVEDLKNIALAIGEKILQTSLRASEDVVRRMVLSAISRMKKTAWAKIHIGSGGKPLAVTGDRKFLNELGTLSDNVKVILSEEDELGSCYIETPEEIVDASVKTQLENIKDLVENARI